MDLQWIVKLIADGLVVPVVLIGAYALIKIWFQIKRSIQVYSQVLMAGFDCLRGGKNYRVNLSTRPNAPVRDSGRICRRVIP